MKTNYITPAGAKKLREELDHLWRQERPRVTQEVSEAAAQGDRSENAEYIYGKRRLREIDRRIRFLTKRLEALKVVDPSLTGQGQTRVFFGAHVRLEDEDGKILEYQIVGPDEFDVSNGKISIDSPMAQALLKKEEGDDVWVRRPKGENNYIILKVVY